MNDYLIHIRGLPDFLTEDELAHEFAQFIEKANQMSLYDALSALRELAERQCDTYSPLAPVLHDGLENWLKQQLTMDDPEFWSKSAGIILMLGFKSTWRYLRDYFQTHEIPSNIKKDILSVICYPEKGLDDPSYQLTPRELDNYNKQRCGWVEIQW